MRRQEKSTDGKMRQFEPKTAGGQKHDKRADAERIKAREEAAM